MRGGIVMSSCECGGAGEGVGMGRREGGPERMMSDS